MHPSRNARARHFCAPDMPAISGFGGQCVILLDSVRGVLELAERRGVVVRLMLTNNKKSKTRLTYEFHAVTVTA